MARSRGWLALGVVLWTSAGAGLSVARAQQVEHVAATSAPGDVSHYAASLARRVSRLEPALLTALASARSGRRVGPARCLDRALSELHSVDRQVAYHADAFRMASDDPSTRQRHARALTVLSARLDYLASSVERCSEDGTAVRHGTTRVEVTIPER